MPIMPWNSSLCIDVKEIDEQHKKLVGLFNDLGDLMKFGKGDELVGRTLSELLKYTDYHFSAEEKLMDLHNYPALAQHKAEHDALIKKVADLHKDSKNDIYLASHVLRLLREWLFKHIAEEDIKIGYFLKGKKL